MFCKVFFSVLRKTLCWCVALLGVSNKVYKKKNRYRTNQTETGQINYCYEPNQIVPDI